ncbi:MAG: hypothetical protein WC989_06585 [Micavibrio sp.]
MDFDKILLSENAAPVAPATANHTGAEIDAVEKRASAEVKVLESAEGNPASGGGRDAGGLIADMALETLLPGGKMLTAGLELGTTRAHDRMAMGLSGDAPAPRTMDEQITQSFRSPKPSGEKLVSDVANVRSSLLNRAAGDKVTEDFAGGGKKNAQSIPANEAAANELNMQARNQVSVLKNHHKLAQDSVLVHRAAHQAKLGQARAMAPGMDLSSGPRYRGDDAIAMARRHQEDQGGA